LSVGTGRGRSIARGRILLPNNRAVRTVTEAFVRASGSVLVLPRLIPIGDPELEERIGGALDPADRVKRYPRRSIRLLACLRSPGWSKRMLEVGADRFGLPPTLPGLDALLIERIDPNKLRSAADDAGDIARH
jgi:ATP-dependent helicase/nuclease subunit B